MRKGRGGKEGSTTTTPTCRSRRWTIPFVAARPHDPIYDVQKWTDLSPRVGATYDLFKNGKTVVRGNYGSYLASESTNMATLNNPRQHVDQLGKPILVGSQRQLQAEL